MGDGGGVCVGGVTIQEQKHVKIVLLLMQYAFVLQWADILIRSCAEGERRTNNVFCITTGSTANVCDGRLVP